MAEAARIEIAGAALEVELGEALRAADQADPAGEPHWRLAETPDWESIESLRVLTAAFGETALLIVIARPAGAEGTDEEAVAGLRLSPAGAEAIEETLVSTEYDADGAVRRVGAELWPGAGIARRLAADRSGEPVESAADGVRREAVAMAFRLDGVAGSGMHELLRAA
jgi:hypothetical protein